ncbi:MAG: type IV secretory system conjugative DNA transfer family protein [Fibrobacter sp.]|nr:type IV secretory system conjugative DNA transfer family protein [Fibrobacter sp.]
MGNIGFISNEKTSQEILSNSNENLIFRYDDKNGISMQSANHNILVTGTTGSGKTSSVILPMLNNLISSGKSGVIIDVKNNFTEKVYTIAKEYGREHDIVEIGNADTAHTVNLFRGLVGNNLTDFIEKISIGAVGNQTGNKDFLLKGVSLVVDVYNLLKILHKFDKRLQASIKNISILLSNIELSTWLFNKFKNNFYDRNDKKHVRFFNKICSDKFSIFSKAISGKLTSEQSDQIQYRISTVSACIERFSSASGIDTKLFSENGDELNIEKMVYDSHKIIVLRMTQGAGSVAPMLAREIIERYYKAVFSRGLSLPKDKYTFLIADEFQDVALFDQNKVFNDVAFTAKAREFNNISIYATQSLSALASRNIRSSSEVLAFLANCTNKIYLYNDDIETIVTAQRYGLTEDLMELPSGKAFAVQFEPNFRKRFCGIRSIQNEYSTVRDILKDCKNSQKHSQIITPEISGVESYYESILQEEENKNIYSNNETIKKHPENFDKHTKKYDSENLNKKSDQQEEEIMWKKYQKWPVFQERLNDPSLLNEIPDGLLPFVAKILIIEGMISKISDKEIENSFYMENDDTGSYVQYSSRHSKRLLNILLEEQTKNRCWNCGNECEQHKIPLCLDCMQQLESDAYTQMKIYENTLL